MFAGKCPKCEKLCAHIEARPVEMKNGFNAVWHGLASSCPHCQTILSVSVDPIAVQQDTVAAISKLLKGGR